MASWHCPSCGGQNPEQTRFCGHCGAPVGSPAPELAGASTDVDETLRSFVSGQVADRLIETGGHLTEERRLVTALFADLSGFTPLSERLDPEDLLEVIDPIIRSLSNIVGRYGGFVEKFAGDALLALFGAPVAHEDDTSRALLVADEMHRELAMLRSRLGPDAADLTLHIGVNTGHGVARMIGSEVRLDYAVLGDSVILAQRLESAAPPGETYVGETTHALTAGRFAFTPVGPLTLKGKAEPVAAWRLDGGRAVSERSATGATQSSTLLVGRERELADVEAKLDTVMRGRTTVVIVRGEPGVGKSRLSEAVRDQAETRGMRWLETRCLSYGAALPYWPIVDLVRRVAGIVPNDSSAAAARRLVAAWPSGLGTDGLVLRMMGLPSEDPSPIEPEAFRRALHPALAGWLRLLAVDVGVVLAVEDAHWIDSSTLTLLEELGRSLSGAPVMLYVTARPVEAGAADPISAISHPPDGTEVPLSIDLQPLDAEGTNQVASSLLDGTPPPDLVDLLVERAAGNPFFIGEIVRALMDSNALADDGGRWRLRTGWSSEVPPTVEGMIAARLDALPSGVAEVLQIASVLGRRVRMALLRMMATRPGLDAQLERLLNAGLLDPGSESGEAAVVFHHALVLDVAYGRLLRRRRRELHRRAAEVAEQLYGTGDDTIESLARHLYLGGGGGKAIEYLLRAGDRARRLFATDEAIVQYERAEELTRQAATDMETRRRLVELLVKLAELLETRGDYEQARNRYAEVRDATGDARAWRGIASTLRRQGRYDEALAVVDAAFAHPAAGTSDARPLWLERGWSLAMAGSITRAIAAYESGLASASTQDTMTGQLLVELARAQLESGAVRRALDSVRRAQGIFEETNDLRGLAHALRVAGGIHQDSGDYEAAASTLRRGLELAERVGSVEEIGGCLVNLGLVERDREHWAEAIACDRRAIDEFERVGHASGRAIAYGNLAEKLARTGELVEAEEYCQRASQVAASIGHAMVAAGSVAVLGEIRLAQGKAEDAIRLAEDAAARYLAAEAAPSAAECYELASRAARVLLDEARAARFMERSRAIVTEA